MNYKSKFFGRLFPSLCLAAIVILVAVISGCGRKDSGAEKKVSSIVPGRQSKQVVSQQSVPVEDARSETAKPSVSIVSKGGVETQPPKEVTYKEAEEAYMQGDFDQAVELFARYTEQKSENPWGYYMLGLSARKTGDYEKAKEALEEALKLDPKHVKSMLNLSRVLLDMEKPEEAMERITDAISNDENCSAAYRLRGLALEALGQTKKALEDYRRAIVLDPEDAWSMNNMGLIFIKRGLFDKALPCLARAVELRSDVAVFENNLGMALEHGGHFRKAEEAYGKAVAIDGNYEKASLNLERISEVKEDISVESVDLEKLAQSFQDEIESWKFSELESEEPETVSTTVDTFVVSNSDSIPRQK